MPYSNCPEKLEVKAGKTVAICSCGESEKGLICDGSHGPTGRRPWIFKADSDKSIMVCACGKTDKPPYCDGSHSR